VSECSLIYPCRVRSNLAGRPAGTRGRATPMSPDERRRAIVAVVLPLLVEHGRAVTTRQIAEAAGIAEGTIFRVFETKEELVEAALAAAFDPEPFIAALDRIDPDQPLRDRLVALVGELQSRFVEIFRLLRAVGLVAPPRHLDADPETDPWRAHAHRRMVALVEPDAHRIRVSSDRLVHLLRLLTFAGSHEEISDHRTLDPDEIVDVVLNGTLAVPTKEDRC
jgi:AcrR family transcriptional regulator